MSNALIGPYDERWFVECKHHEGGVNLADLGDKIEWAKAEGPDHVLIIVSSYLTQHTAEWLELMRANCHFKIHVIEGKALKSLLLTQPALIVKYFQEETAILIRDLIKQWTIHDILPEPRAMYDIVQKGVPEKLDGQSLAFLWSTCHQHEEEISKYCDEEDLPVFDYQFLLPFFESRTTHGYPVFTPEKMTSRNLRFNAYSFTLIIHSSGKEKQVHGYLKMNDGRILEVYLRRRDGQLDCRIGIGTNAPDILERYKNNQSYR